jgi:molybdate transport system substrate-binding protein
VDASHACPITRVNRRRSLSPSPSRALRSLILLLVVLYSPAGAFAAPASPAGSRHAPLVAAAADLKFALDEIVGRFQRETGVDARVSYGSSGNFARQIEQGAPYELFLSADESFVHALARQGLTRDAGELYAVGRLAVYAPHGSPLVPDPGLENLRLRVDAGKLGRFAIANPEHAPYGRAAEQALRAVGVWDAVRPRLVYGENVAQAAQFASGGSADGGIIALSLALSPELARRGGYALLPASLHAPLRQRMVLLANASPDSIRLYEYLRSSASRAILARYGFELPPE